MGKKRTRATKTSKGQRSAMKNVHVPVSPLTVALNKLEAWKKGQNPWLTVAGDEKNRPFIRRRANDVLGDPRTAFYNIYGKPKKGEQAY